MKPTIKINQIRSKDEDSLSYRITVKQGAELITSKDLLLDYLKTSVPYKKGITNVTRVSSEIWEVKTNK